MTGAPDGRCLRLRSATADLHRQAERRPLIAALLRGRLRATDYARLLRNLHPVYGALEARLDEANHLPDAVRGPALRRRAALEADLLALLGTDWPRQAPQPEALAYARHLRDVDEAGLLAHVWLRYLGDLAGGQLLAQSVARLLDRDDGLGTAFYRFGPPGAAQLARAFRAALDALPLDAAAERQLIDEACAGFRRHAELFDALYGLRG